MKKLNKNVYVHTTASGLNIGCVVGDDGAVSIDLPMAPEEALAWKAQIAELSPRPLRAIIFTSPDRVNSEVLRALTPHLGPFSVPAVIHDAGYNQLYAALENAQPRMLEPLSPVQLRERAVLPDLTFSDSATFTLGLEHPLRVDITHMGGYAPGSSTVSIRDSGIVFTGDHVTVGEPPSLAQADADKWLKALAALKRNRKIKIVVPGRGPVGELAALDETMAYLKAAQSGVKTLVRRRQPREEVRALAIELAGQYLPKRSAARDKAAAQLAAEALAQRIQGGLERMYDELTAQVPAAA
jgi:glyoxylase-like metal-dependent hydrolase (beta-lactamase superfamily II)